MKNICQLLILLLCSLNSYSQLIQSSCEISQEIRSRYSDDAEKVALDFIHTYRNKLDSQIIIDSKITDTILTYFSALFNARLLPERDTIYNLYSIHHNPEYETNTIRIEADSNLSWMQNLRKNQIQSGNSLIDSLFADFGFYEIIYDVIFDKHIVHLRSHSNVNVRFLSQLIMEIPGVYSARSIQPSFSGSQILFELKMDTAILQFKYCWGDDGCNFNRNWIFRIDPNCMIELDTAYGDVLHPSTVLSLSRWQEKVECAYPVPFQSYLNFLTSSNVESLTIRNSLGQIVFESEVSNNQISGLSELPNGIYYLYMETSEGSFNVRTQKN